MKKLNSLLWLANIEILYGSLNPASSIDEVLNSKKAQTVSGPKGSVPGTLRVPSEDEMKNYFNTAGAAGYDLKKTHWCGIFQTYLLVKAGVACHWGREIVDDSGGRDLEIVKGSEAQKGLAVGDIVRIHRQEHHFMVIDPVVKGSIRSFEGNAGGLKHRLLAANWMGNMAHNVVEDIYIRYRVIG
jgi:hypothetical protein